MLAKLLILSAAAATASAAIQWRSCPDPLDAPGLQCAELSVPLNWTDTKGKSIAVGLTRLKAKDTANRIGSLVFNPGGPAQPASLLLAGQALGESLFAQNITDVFDIIGFDPRGVGPIGTPITCDPEIFNNRVTYYPTGEDEYKELMSANEAAWSNCAKLTGPLLFNVDTRSMAHDLEALRVALGDGVLNFLGVSYGTMLAQTYARMYPGNFRAIAMDAVIDHNSTATAEFLDEAQAFESSLHRFADWCNSTNTTVCPLSGRDVLAIYNETVSNAFVSPLAAPGCEGTTIGASGGCFPNITGAEIISTTQSLLLYKAPKMNVTVGWPGLAGALALASQGNGTAMAHAYADSNLATSNTSQVFAASTIPCLDFNIDISSHSDVEHRLNLGSVMTPITRGLSFKWSQQAHCIGFPRNATNPQDDMTVDNVTPMLITQSMWDPNAAYVWAEQARNQIKNNTLVLRQGDGHTSAFLDGGNGQTAEVIGKYFVTGQTPAQNLVVST